VQFQRLGKHTQLAHLSRHQAAVAADLVLTWRDVLGDIQRGSVRNGLPGVAVAARCFDSTPAVGTLHEILGDLRPAGGTSFLELS
jgi:hypothetical protein